MNDSKEKIMKKILLAFAFALCSVSAAMAHEAGETSAHHHAGMRAFTSPEVNIMEFENIFSGTFHGSYMQMSPNKKQDGYEGYVLYNGKKIKAELAPQQVKGSDGKKIQKLGGKFGDVSFVFDSLDAKNGVYTFKHGEETATVSILFEYRKGKHMVNPVFVVKNNNRSYIVRMEGESCYGRGLYFAAMLYGMSNFDANPVQVKAVPPAAPATDKPAEKK